MNKLYHPRVIWLISCYVDFGKVKFNLESSESLEQYLTLPSSYPFYLKKSLI